MIEETGYSDPRLDDDPAGTLVALGILLLLAAFVGVLAVASI